MSVTSNYWCLFKNEFTAAGGSLNYRPLYFGSCSDHERYFYFRVTKLPKSQLEDIYIIVGTAFTSSHLLLYFVVHLLA